MAPWRGSRTRRLLHEATSWWPRWVQLTTAVKQGGNVCRLGPLHCFSFGLCSCFSFGAQPSPHDTLPPPATHAHVPLLPRAVQVIVLGSAPDPKVNAEFQALQASTARSGDVRVVLRHDEALSHRIYAGADMIFIPSFFEPCGLTQLISLRWAGRRAGRTGGEAGARLAGCPVVRQVLGTT